MGLEPTTKELRIPCSSTELPTLVWQAKLGLLQHLFHPYEVESVQLLYDPPVAPREGIEPSTSRFRVRRSFSELPGYLYNYASKVYNSQELAFAQQSTAP